MRDVAFSNTLGRTLWAALAALAVGGCAPAVHAPAAPARASAGAAQTAPTQGASLHPSVIALLAAQGITASGEQRGVYDLPGDACAAVVRLSASQALRCTALLLGRGATLLVLHEAECAGPRCLERSWVFLRAYRRGLPLPTRRRADYQALRAELSNEQATALWLAGFRGSASDGRTAAIQDVPALADYASCTVAPDERELVCRTLNGGAVGLDPATGALRSIARVELDRNARVALDFAPVHFTEDGQLQLTLRVERHALCGTGPCELVGLVAWPSVTETLAHLVRPDALPY